MWKTANRGSVINRKQGNTANTPRASVYSDRMLNQLMAPEKTSVPTPCDVTVVSARAVHAEEGQKRV